MKIKWQLFLATFVAGVMAAANASAAILVNDTWRDGTRNDPASPTYSENGVDGDADGDLESAWYGSTAVALSSTVGNLKMDNTNGGATTSGSQSYTTYFRPDGSPVTLAQGQSLKVTWVFTPTAAAAQANTSQNFRLALVDTPNAARLSADGNPGSATYSGYAMFMNMSIATLANPNINLGNSSPFRLMERTDPATASAMLSAGGSWTALGVTGATAGNHGYDSGVSYTFTMSVTRNLADGLDFDVRMAGGTLDNDGLAQVVFTDATPNGGSFSFNTFTLRPSSSAGTADAFDTSLFRVELIPEPASATLAAFGGLAALALRRRR